MHAVDQDMSEHGGKAFSSFVAITFFAAINAFISYLTLTVLAYFFGAGSEIDAFFAAMTLPQVILAILQVIIPATFIPVFMKSRTEGEGNSWRLASIAVNAAFILLAGIAVIGTVFSKRIIALINPGFSAPTAVLSSSLFSYFILSSVFTGVAVMLSSICYARKQFVRPLLAQAVSSAAILSCVMLFHGRLGLRSIAVGTLAGSLIQFFWLQSVLFRRGRYVPSLDLRQKEVVSLLALMLPLLLGSLFYKTNVVVERFISSRLAPGSIAYLGYAGKINSALLILLTQGISLPLFQRLSERSAVMDLPGLRDALSRGLRAMILLVTPVALLIVLAGNDLVRLAFQRGSFTPQATRAVGMILLAYLGYLLVSTVGLPVLNTLYSLQLTTTIALVGAGGFILYVLLALVLSRVMGCTGVALAASLQSLISISCFLWIVAKRIGRIPTSPILRCLQKAILASGASFALIIPLKHFLRGLAGPNLVFMLGTAVAFCVYGGALMVLRTEELAFISKRFLRKG
ncbi:MAG: lipid II flippase MurJ [Acidobacteriota bacterium]|nr:lipid II flippase MurJ [Acidobacteriota bacterium]